MGFFSWQTCDTGESLQNVYAAAQKPFYILLPDNTTMRFVSYDGYGRFVDAQGELTDAFELLAELNGWVRHEWEDNSEQLREMGLSLMWHPELFGTQVFLKISFDPNAKYSENPPSRECPNQGYFGE